MDTLIAACHRQRAVKPIAWVLHVVLAALFGCSGIMTLLGLQPEVVEQFDVIGAGPWFRYLTGALELAGAIGLLIPRLAGLAALALAGIMPSAVLVYLFSIPSVYYAWLHAGLGIALCFIACCRWLGDRRPSLDRNALLVEEHRS